MAYIQITASYQVFWGLSKLSQLNTVDLSGNSYHIHCNIYLSCYRYFFLKNQGALKLGDQAIFADRMRF